MVIIALWKQVDSSLKVPPGGFLYGRVALRPAREADFGLSRRPTTGFGALAGVPKPDRRPQSLSRRVVLRG
jgi:hypothetical protein